MLNKTINILFLLAIWCSCLAPSFAQSGFSASGSHQYSLKELNTSISGIVADATEKVVQLSYFKNSLSFKEETMLLPIAKDGSFSVDFDLTSDLEIRLTYGEASVPLYLQKGDDLKLDFRGDNLLKSLVCSGRGQYNNQFLVDMQNAFVHIDQGFVLYEIEQKNSIDFKQTFDKILQQKNKFYLSYDIAAKTKMTPGFKDYIRIDNQYWHANQMLNYRIEKPLRTGEAAPLELPSAYYRFLEDMEMDKTVLLQSRNYCEFLEEYLKYKGELNAADKTLNYVIKKVEQENMLYSEEGEFVHLAEGEQVAILNANESAMNKEAIAKLLPVFKADKLDFVKLENGTKGWVSDLKVSQTSNQKINDASTHRIKKYAVNRMHNTKLYKEPGQKEVTGALGYGEEVKYLHLKTSEHFKYYHQGMEYYGTLVQVENNKGQRGWVLNSFLDLMEKKVSREEVQSVYLYDLTDTSEARQYLKGEALYYTLAKALYWKIKLYPNADIAREIAAFASHNEYKELNEILRAEYDVEQLRKKRSDDFIETYVYSNLQSPVIGGLNVGLPFDKSAFIQATRSQSEKEYVDIPHELKDRPSSSVQISGKIFAGAMKEANLTIVYDYISFQEESVPLVVDAEGKYHFSTELQDPVLAYLRCGDKSIEMYLFPGDKINIDFDVNNFPNSVRMEGKSAALNTYLLEEAKVFAPQFEMLVRKSETSNGEDFMDFTKSLHKKRKQFSDKYKKKNKLTSMDMAFISSNLDYSYATMMFNYEDIQQYVQRKDEVVLPKNFYAFLKDMPISVEGVLPNIHYVDFVNQFLEHQKKQGDNQFLTKAELAKQFFKGEVLAFVQAKELATKCQLGKAHIYGNAIQEFIVSNEHEQYNNVLRAIYNENKPIQTGSTAPDFALTDIDGNTVQLSDLKGKVVCIDFWATWCRPCIKSMTYSQRMINQYKGKDVVFLYVSMDENTSTWETYVKGQGLQGKHLNASSGKGYLSNIAKLYKVKQLPTYVIIDKDGKVAFNKKGSPGNTVLGNLIDGLLATPFK